MDTESALGRITAAKVRGIALRVPKTCFRNAPLASVLDEAPLRTRAARARQGCCSSHEGFTAESDSRFTRIRGSGMDDRTQPVRSAHTNASSENFEIRGKEREIIERHMNNRAVKEGAIGADLK